MMELRSCGLSLHLNFLRSSSKTPYTCSFIIIKFESVGLRQLIISQTTSALTYRITNIVIIFKPTKQTLNKIPAIHPPPFPSGKMIIFLYIRRLYTNNWLYLWNITLMFNLKTNYMIDFSVFYEEGLRNLQTWKTRYSTDEYPQKVELNIFYRRMAMKRAWPQILAYADRRHGVLPYNRALQELQTIYANSAAEINPILESYLKTHATEDMGGATFEFYQHLAFQASFLRQAKHSLETSYLFYMMSDCATLVWAAIAASGVDKVKAVAEVTGCIIQPMPLNDYSTVSNGIGQLAVSGYIEKRYRM